MTRSARRIGRIIRNAPAAAQPALREVATLDRRWRTEGKAEGRTANRLAWKLGIAARAGAGRESQVIQCEVAASRGERSGWESYLGLA
jgi:hypothetical protein